MDPTASAKAFDEEAVSAAVRVHVRHRETSYDKLLSDGVDRGLARAEIRTEVEKVLREWGG